MKKDINETVKLTPFGGSCLSKSTNSVTKSCQAVSSATSRKYLITWVSHVGKLSSFLDLGDGETAGVAGRIVASSVLVAPSSMALSLDGSEVSQVSTKAFEGAESALMSEGS